MIITSKRKEGGNELFQSLIHDYVQLVVPKLIIKFHFPKAPWIYALLKLSEKAKWIP